MQIKFKMAKEYDIRLLETVEKLKKTGVKPELVGECIYYAVLENQLIHNKLYSKGPNYARRFRRHEAERIQNSIHGLEAKTICEDSIFKNSFSLNGSLDKRLTIAANTMISRMNFIYDATVFLYQKTKSAEDTKSSLGQVALCSFESPLSNSVSLYYRFFANLHSEIREKYNIDLETNVSLNTR